MSSGKEKCDFWMIIGWFVWYLTGLWVVCGWFVGVLTGLWVVCDGVGGLWVVCEWFGWFEGGFEFCS